ncbi:MAG: response regulator [Pseudomonadota bacterium]
MRTQPPQTILVVEDEPDIASVLVDYLRHEGFAPQHVDNGTAALDCILRQPPALVLLDVMLPGRDGISVLQAVRQHSQVPIIMLTARVEEVDRLLGLDLGADDYICKPFSPREVMARVHTVLRRSLPSLSNAHAVPRALVLDRDNRSASLHGQALNLTAKEFELLRVLAASPGRVFARSQLLDSVYSDDLEANQRAVDSHIKNLRRKCAAIDPDHEWIRSVYGVGFVLEEKPGDC